MIMVGRLVIIIHFESLNGRKTMSENNGRTPIDMGVYAMNRAKFPVEELAHYRGEHIAFSADGTRIVAHGTDRAAVIAELQKRGIHLSEVGWGFIPKEDFISPS